MPNTSPAAAGCTAASSRKDLEAKIPAEGAVLSYDFEAKTAGDYEAWVRIGYEFARSPFSWRLDDGAWKESKPEELTTDLMALQAWNEVAWLKLGGVALQPGKHTFEIKFDRQYKDKQRQEGAGPHPVRPRRDLPLQGRVAAERAAQAGREREQGDRQGGRRAGLRGPGGEVGGGERGVTPLGGAWQIARLDEQEIKDRTEPVKELPVEGGRPALEGNQGPRQPRRRAARPAIRPPLRLPHPPQRSRPSARAGRSSCTSPATRSFRRPSSTASIAAAARRPAPPGTAT